MGYDTVYFTDDVPRNAVRVISEGHPGNNGRSNSRGTVVRAVGQREGMYGTSPYGMSPYGLPGSYPAVSHQIVMTPNGPMAVPVAAGFSSSVLAESGLSTGEWIDVGLQVVAALMPLPAAPPTSTSVEDNAANGISYQTAIASYAKRDELLRTAASLIKTLFRRG